MLWLIDYYIIIDHTGVDSGHTRLHETGTTYYNTSVMASQITGNVQQLVQYNKKEYQSSLLSFCENPPMTRGFRSQSVSNAESAPCDIFIK